MGTYYHLACRPCGQYIHFGKKLHEDDTERLQGMYSEQSQEWMADARVWQALQAFLFEHTGHALFFDHDAHDHAIEEYTEVDADSLLETQLRGQVEHP
jgi:hypothetical protein